MAFDVLRQVPERRKDGQAEALLATLETAAGEVASSLGSRPAALRDVLDALAAGVALPPRDAVRARRAPLALHVALDGLRETLFTVPGRDREARLLWREALATGWLAADIARLAGGSPGTAGLAGLLHRAGDALALRTIARFESTGQVRLDASSVQSTAVTFEPEFTAALGRAWKLAPGVVAALQGWRRVGEGSSVGAEARAVHFGHAFASQVLFAEFPAPGLAAAVEAALRLDRRELARLRAGFEPLRDAVDTLLGEAQTRR
ncbi:MAG: HDOD domain-containing protein [Steroidobacteraceae bacterium]